MNHNINLPLILASGSPRRSALLSQMGIPFEVQVSGVDESDAAFDDPVEGTRALALQKAMTVASRQKEYGRIVLGADSIVVVGGDVLGKPADVDDAFRMLKRLVGQTHHVITGIALVETGTGRSIQAHEQTLVQMRSCTDDEIAAYVATGEPMDKAGSYGAQGKGAALVERVEGCFNNVIGLPVSRLIVELRLFLIGGPHRGHSAGFSGRNS